MKLYLIFLPFISFMTACSLGHASTNWPDRTVKDLAAVRNLITLAHPGAIDDQNRDFHAWLDGGYEKAIELASQARSDRDSLAVLRYYATGFEDGHLGVNRDLSGRSSWAGFVVEMQGTNYIVSKASSNWPVTLPPVGSRMVSCDGRSAEKIITHDIAPYIDRRLYLKSAWNQLAKFLTVDIKGYPVFARKFPGECLVEQPDGSQKRFPLLWQEEDEELESFLFPAAPPTGLKYLGDGRYWIHVHNFMPSAQDNIAIERLIKDIEKINDARLVVFDTRGNRGGNSIIGAKLIHALLGDELANNLFANSQAYAMWRVSPFALNTLQKTLLDINKNYGTDNDSYRFVRALERSMEGALAVKQKWLKQPEVSLPSLSGKNTEFKGKLALITDSHCASACLDFADPILHVPGSIHLGLPTGADTQYIDIGHTKLPSQTTFWLPLKVWRGRARGHNQAYTPIFSYEGDINDTEGVQTWALDILK